MVYAAASYPHVPVFRAYAGMAGEQRNNGGVIG